MTEVCVVKKVNKRGVYVELVQSEKCEGCNICAFNKKKSLVVPALCDIEVRESQSVVVEMPTVAVGGASLLIYAIPLLLTVVGALIGLVGGLWLQVGLAAAGLVLGFVCAWLIDRAYRRRDGVLPKVLRVVETNTVAEVNTQDNNPDQGE